MVGPMFKQQTNCEVNYTVKTQRNSTQLNSTKATQKQLRWVRHSTHLEPTPPHPYTNFSVTSRPVRELKFGTDTH